MLLHLVDWIAGGCIGWLIAHLYYRRSQADSEHLREVIERAIREGLVQAERNAAGQISELKRPSAPTSFKLE
jgi:hypothetical protein